MCGINGILGSSGIDLEAAIRGMNLFLAKRGPDGEGIFIDGDCALGHTRLSIVDAKNSDANQPFVFGDYIITFNGEIYNHKEIRKILEEKGHKFRTGCDTEVIVQGFAEYGEQILDMIKGQFAFAIYDRKTKETLLARDRTAKKPLYYSVSDKGVIFSSSSRAISSIIGFSPDLESIATLLLNGSAFAAGEEPLGASTVKGISSLMPGEYAVVSPEGEMKRSRYYSLPIGDIVSPKSEAEYITELRQKMTHAILTRIPDEVSFGCALSGGLDSSIVTAIAADSIDKEIVASCIRYTADKSNPDYDHAKILADSRKNIRLVSSDISPENFLDDLEDMVAALGIQDSIRQLAMFRNYKVLHENGVKVVLTGEGADEFNFGYHHKFPGLKLDQEACSTEEGLRELVSRRMPYVLSLLTEEAKRSIDMEKSLDYLTRIYNSFGTTDSTRKMMGVYAVDFLGFLNKANDRCAMANSIESRCPFQDVDVIETCLQIPREYQISEEPGMMEKRILRRAFRHVLPEEIYTRAKAPLPAASNIAYHEKIAEEFDRRLGTVDPSFFRYFNKESLIKLSESYRARIAELKSTCSPEEAGASLMSFRAISEDADILNGKNIRTNDVFKLLTAMVYYDQNVR